MEGVAILFVFSLVFCLLVFYFGYYCSVATRKGFANFFFVHDAFILFIILRTKASSLMPSLEDISHSFDATAAPTITGADTVTTSSTSIITTARATEVLHRALGWARRLDPLTGGDTTAVYVLAKHLLPSA
jgi:hypothetical protein